jgi:hypothetical protein
MSTPIAKVWSEAPEIGIPEPPAFLADTESLWLAYEVAPSNGIFAVVCFTGIIDHHLSPINDEGLGEHPYSSAGLEWYSFNELKGTREAEEWCALGARHWVISFKDNTLDVLAKGVEIVADSIRAKNSLSALLSVACQKPAQPGA